MISLTQPWALVLLPLAALPLFLRWLRASAVPRLDLRPVDGASRTVDHGLTALGILGLGALVLGLAQPYLRGGSVVHRGIGTNLVLLIDRSSSMDDTFAGRSPSGAEESKASAARRILMDFIAGRPDDRIGIAAFSTAPMLVLPMTESRSAIASAVSALAEPGLSQTDVGRGLTLAMGMAAQEAATGARAVVLVSDGAAVISPEVQVMLRNLAATFPPYSGLVQRPGIRHRCRDELVFPSARRSGGASRPDDRSARPCRERRRPGRGAQGTQGG